jgi:hypothetical protein
MHAKPLPVVLLLISPLFVSPSRAEHRADWKARFLDHAPEEWKKLEKHIFSLEGSYTQTDTSFGGPGARVPRQKRVDYYFNSRHDGKKLVFRDVPEKGMLAIFCSNGEYRFNVDRMAQGQGLSLRYCLPGPNPDRYRGSVETALTCSENLFNFPISNYVGSMESVTPEMSGEKTFIRIRFMRKLDGVDGLFPGSVLVDPSFHWAVVLAQQEMPWGKQEQHNEYQELNGVAFPKHSIYMDFAKGVAPNTYSMANTCTVDFEVPKPCNLPASEFRLEAYGMKPTTRPYTNPK